MSDLISRQAAIEALMCTNPTEPYIDYDDAVKAIQDLPSAEKRGRWKRIKAYPDLVFCDECGEPFKSNPNEEWNYCPNCGCKNERR